MSSGSKNLHAVAGANDPANQDSILLAHPNTYQQAMRIAEACEAAAAAARESLEKSVRKVLDEPAPSKEDRQGK